MRIYSVFKILVVKVTTWYDNPVTWVQAILIFLSGIISDQRTMVIICGSFCESFEEICGVGIIYGTSALTLVAQAILPSIPTIH